MVVFYADEDFPGPVTDALRALGYDVLTVQQDGRAGGDDGASALALWKRSGKRAFDAEAAEGTTSADATGGED